MDEQLKCGCGGSVSFIFNNEVKAFTGENVKCSTFECKRCKTYTIIHTVKTEAEAIEIFKRANRTR